MSDEGARREGWNPGGDPWLSAMENGRRWLDELGRQVRATAETSVKATDLGPVVDAIELLEGRVGALDARVQSLDGKVDALVARLGDLTSVLEALADRVAKP